MNRLPKAIVNHHGSCTLNRNGYLIKNYKDSIKEWIRQKNVQSFSTPYFKKYLSFLFSL